MSMMHAMQSVFAAGGAPVTYTDPDTWTLIDFWRVADGDMTVIDNAFGNQSDGRSGSIWSLDGTVLTLASFGNDTIRSFSCSTPFDPDTATLIATRSQTNPGHLFANADGSSIYTLATPDTIFEFATLSPFVIPTNAQLASATSALTKAEMGWSGSTDPSYYPLDDFSALYTDGPISSTAAVKRIDFTTPGDLDTEVLGANFFSENWTVNSAIKGSKVSKEGTRIYRGVGAPGIEIIEFSTPYLTTSMSLIGTFDNPAEWGTFRPEHVWINPEDTSEVMIAGNTGRLEIYRMATNA